MARLGLEKCREDLTDCFICLLLTQRKRMTRSSFRNSTPAPKGGSMRTFCA